MARSRLTQGRIQQALAALGEKKGSSIPAIQQYLARERSKDAPSRVQVAQVLKRSSRKMSSTSASSAANTDLARTGNIRFRLNLKNLDEAASRAAAGGRLSLIHI